MKSEQEKTIDLMINALLEKRPEVGIPFIIQMLCRCKKCGSDTNTEQKCPDCGKAFFYCPKCKAFEKYLLCEQKVCSKPLTKEEWDLCKREVEADIEKLKKIKENGRDYA